MLRFIGATVIWLLAASASAQSLEDIVWVTEEYPPYNYSKDGVADGLAVELLVEIWKSVGLTRSRQDIKVWPWPRGVRAIKTQPGTSLFATTLTAQRADEFGWKFVFPIPQIAKQSNNHLLARKGSGIRFGSVEELKLYKNRFGVVNNDIGGDLLREAGVSERGMDPSPDASTLVKKLARGRIDVISYGLAAATATMVEQGISPDDYEVVFSFPRKPMGYAFHRDTDRLVIRRLQDALNRLIADGTAEQIRLKYVK